MLCCSAGTGLIIIKMSKRAGVARRLLCLCHSVLFLYVPYEFPVDASLLQIVWYPTPWLFMPSSSWRTGSVTLLLMMHSWWDQRSRRSCECHLELLMSWLLQGRQTCVWGFSSRWGCEETHWSSGCLLDAASWEELSLRDDQTLVPSVQDLESDLLGLVAWFSLVELAPTLLSLWAETVNIGVVR